MAEEFSIKEWVKEVIHGVGGLESYEDHEVADQSEDPRLRGAEWVIRCLANPECEGSRKALDAIYDRRRSNRLGKRPTGDSEARRIEEMRDDHDGPIHPDLHLPSGWNDG
jgi:hypothetical protein